MEILLSRHGIWVDKPIETIGELKGKQLNICVKYSEDTAISSDALLSRKFVCVNCLIAFQNLEGELHALISFLILFQ